MQQLIEMQRQYQQSLKEEIKHPENPEMNKIADALILIGTKIDALTAEIKSLNKPIKSRQSKKKDPPLQIQEFVEFEIEEPK